MAIYHVYDYAKYDIGFDTMHSCKIRCRVCVDKIMDKLTKKVVTEDKKLTKKCVIEYKKTQIKGRMVLKNNV